EWAPYFGQVTTASAVRDAYAALVREAQAARRPGAAVSLEALAARFAPTELFDSERELRVGRFTVELHHVGPGHTDNDAFLVVPEERLVIAGDLVYVGVHPYVDVGAGANTWAWQRSLDALDAACARVARAGGSAAVVPGHGPATDRAAVAGQRAYFDRLRAAVESALREGRSRAEVTALTVPGLPTQRADVGAANLGVIYDELRAATR
ncbi:MAG TPA: MBL fold metallo-hydrolase, partial [Gemmatimonadaceae bacterium]|nr:MBL fold metallo-hydrolase [Gemmatimonadaceae bacterium]